MSQEQRSNALGQEQEEAAKRKNPNHARCLQANADKCRLVRVKVNNTVGQKCKCKPLAEPPLDFPFWVASMSESVQWEHTFEVRHVFVVPTPCRNAELIEGIV